MSRRPSRFLRGAGALAALLTGMLVGWLWWHAQPAEPVAAESVSELDSVPVVDPGALAGLHAASTAPRDDVRLVGAVLRNYLQSVRGGDAPPLGFNEEIVRALAGANPLGVAFLPPAHPAIDGQGRLCDRWGSPYHFHPLAVDAIEVRSAGPDRRLFTADDLVAESPQE